jgi:hypothetical protein
MSDAEHPSTEPPATPDPPRAESPRDRRMRAAAIAWLAILGAAAMTVGGHDTAVGREIAVRLAGTAVLAAGVMLLVGAVGLRGSRSHGEALASLAALLGAALGFIMFLAQAVNDDPDSRLIIWGAIAGLSLVVWWFVRSQMSGEEREQGVFGRLPVLKSALTATFVFTLVQFWYTNIYVPTKGPVNVEVRPEFDAPEKRGGRVLVRGTVTIQNKSSTRIIVVASGLLVSATRPRERPISDDAYEEAESKADAGSLDAARRYVDEISPGDRWLRGRLVADDFFFEPGETVTRPFVAWLPHGDYDVARVDVRLAIGRLSIGEIRDDSEPIDVRHVGTSPEDETVVTRRVPEDGWISGLTRNDRYLIARYRGYPFDDAARYQPFAVGFDRKPSTTPPDDFSHRMIRVYGIGIVGGAAVVSLPPLDE